MQYGICHLSSVPVRLIAEESGEMTTQLLYGDYFKVLEQRKLWSKIRIAFDGFEGWITNKQYIIVSEKNYNDFNESKEIKNSSDLVSFIEIENNILVPILIGSSILHADFLHHKFEGNSIIDKVMDKSNLINTALLYINAPYFWGGKTPFGIDSSGLTQIVYKMNGYKLLRNAAQQATQGEALSFIEESEAGDLAFFDNKDGVIDHVGIIMRDNYIIHSYGKVRIDRIDHTGIYNNEINNYTHKLRVIKKII